MSAAEVVADADLGDPVEGQDRDGSTGQPARDGLRVDRLDEHESSGVSRSTASGPSTSTYGRAGRLGRGSVGARGCRGPNAKSMTSGGRERERVGAACRAGP